MRRCRAEQIRERRGGIGREHKMFADEECVEANGTQAKKIIVCGQAGLAAGDTMLGNLLDQLAGSFGAHGQCLQVAIVHPEDAGARCKRAAEFGAGMNLNERFHAEWAAEGNELGELRIVQCGDNKEKAVGIVGTRFPDLPRIENEILAKGGQSYRFSCLA